MKSIIIENKSLKIALIKFYQILIFKITRLTNGKGYGFLTRVAQSILGKQMVCGKINASSLFCFNLLDDYWNQLIVSKIHYEPEIYTALERLKSVNYLFVDAGANLGYWSVLVSSKELGNKDTIAIEASSTTLELLSNNCNKNDNRFSFINKAVSNVDGETVRFTTGAHAARHINFDGEKAETEAVETITLDSLINNTGAKKDKIVIKLDVEGAEINAMKGAENIISNFDVLFIYEDHGNDPTHAVTDFIKNTLGMPVYYYTDDYTFKSIKIHNELDEIKTNSGIGYNFFAFKERSSFKGLLDVQGNYL
jgi:FkbM family methyltransferase